MKITPLNAAKRAYIALGEQAMLDEDGALEAAEVEDANAVFRKEFRAHLVKVGRRVRKVLGV